MTERENAIWAAGLFEGEGWVSAVRRKLSPPSVQAGVKMTDFPVVERFAAVVGFGTLSVRTLENPKHADQMVWRCWRREDVESLHNMIGPFLGDRRRQQFEDALRHVTPLGLDWHARREYAREYRARAMI